jgi:uncharacterized protein (TIRG00374 family)
MWRRRVRPVAGWAISAALVVLLLGRIDVAEVADAMLHASRAGIVIAIVFVCVEVGLRAWRWQILLEAARPVAYARAVAYLCVGYFANSLLPARLGDLARAHVTGRDLAIPRLTTLGTIVVERIIDATLIVLIVVALGLTTPPARALLAPAAAVLAIGAAASAAVFLALVVVDRSAHRLPAVAAQMTSVVRRIMVGGTALRSRSGAAMVLSLTVAAFLVAVAQFWTIAGAVGLTLTPTEAAIVMGTLALSTSIPAAPGSVGTYELVGVAVLTQLGAAPAPALAAVVLMHVVATLPPALTGLAVFVRLHLHLTDLAPVTGPEKVAA